MFGLGLLRIKTPYPQHEHIVPHTKLLPGYIFFPCRKKTPYRNQEYLRAPEASLATMGATSAELGHLSVSLGSTILSTGQIPKCSCDFNVMDMSRMHLDMSDVRILYKVIQMTSTNLDSLS